MRTACEFVHSVAVEELQVVIGYIEARHVGPVRLPPGSGRLVDGGEPLCQHASDESPGLALGRVAVLTVCNRHRQRPLLHSETDTNGWIGGVRLYPSGKSF